MWQEYRAGSGGHLQVDQSDIAASPAGADAHLTPPIFILSVKQSLNMLI